VSDPYSNFNPPPPVREQLVVRALAQLYVSLLFLEKTQKETLCHSLHSS